MEDKKRNCKRTLAFVTNYNRKKIAKIFKVIRQYL